MAIRSGSWKIGGISLPEFGITEKIQSVIAPNRGTSAQGGSNLFGSQAAAPSYNPPAPQTINPQPSVLGTNTRSVSGTPNIPSQQSPFQQAQQNIQQQADAGNNFIEEDYNNAMSALQGQENVLRGQAGTAEGQISSEAESTKNQISKEQGTAIGGVQNTLSTAETSGKNAMQQARDLFRQTQQNIIMQTSGMGLSSSSVLEGLSERLGVETARRIASVSQSIDDVRINASKEIARVNDYYQGKVTEVQQWAANQKSALQVSLISGLNQINNARNQAASDKSRSRQELLSNLQNAMNQIAQQQQQFELSLQEWNAKKTAALQKVAEDPTFGNTTNSALNNFNTQFSPTGLTYQQANTNQPVGGQITNKNKDYEEFLRQAGIR